MKKMAIAVKNFKFFNRKVTITVSKISSDPQPIADDNYSDAYVFDKNIHNKYMKMQLKPQIPEKWQFNKIG